MSNAIYLACDEQGRWFLRQDHESGGSRTWNFGADPVASKLAAEAKLREINENGPCVECQGQRDLNVMESWRSRLVSLGLCFSCLHWTELLERSRASHVHAEQGFNETDRVVVKGSHYIIAPDAPQWFRGFIGHGGAKFVIRFFDGREVTTHNLWAQGQIPEHFRARLPDNAQFIERSSSTYHGHGSARVS